MRTLSLAVLSLTTLTAARSAAEPAGLPPAPPPAAAPQRPEPKLVTETRTGMGTRLSLQIFTADEAGAKRAAAAAFDELDRVEQLISEWLPTSEISRVNAAAGKEAVSVGEETFRIVEAGQGVARASDGAFALTWAALGGLWPFGQGNAVALPTRAELDQRLPLIGDTLIALDPKARTVRLPRVGMALGVGGIGKGYAAERAVALLAAQGFPDVLVAASGDIVAHGRRGSRPWLVGIQDPRAAGYFATLTLEDKAISTSGDYEKYFEKDGVRYHHLLDPRTGEPARGLRSATLVAPDGMTADAYATAIFVLGPERGMALVEKDPRLGAVLVTDKNEVLISRSLAQAVRVVRPPTP